MNHKETKKKLKLLGGICLVVGGICALIGFVDFFGAIGGEGFPTLFFLLFIGIPLIGIGGNLLSFGYRGEILRYNKNESIPVIKEAGSDLAPTVKELADAYREGKNEKSEEGVICSCGAVNSKTDRFCKNCGKELTRKCPHCGATIAPDCKFCTQCGARLTDTQEKMEKQ